jgi:hypothetical protein
MDEITETNETEQTPIETQTETTEQIQPVLRETKIEIDGNQYSINEKQLKQLWGLPENEEISDKEFKSLVSAYKAQKTADFKSRKASDQEKLVQEIAKMIQENPFELLKRAGYNPRELAEKYLADAIEEDMLPESEKELKRVRSEKELFERQYKEQMERQQQEQMNLAIQQAQQEFTSQIITSLEGSNLPKSPDVVKRIANYLLLGEQRGLSLNPKQIIPLVEEDLRKLNESILKSLDPNTRINYLGEDILKQIRKDDLARVKTMQSNPIPQQQNQKSEKNNKLTKDEFKKLLKQRISA